MDIDDSDVETVACSLRDTLQALPRLKMLVLSLGNARRTDTLARWLDTLGSNDCFDDERLVVVPYACGAEREWDVITAGGRSVWDRAAAFQGMGLAKWIAREEELLEEMEKVANDHRLGCSSRDARDKERAWEIDLVERAGYSAPITDPARQCEYVHDTFLFTMLSISFNPYAYEVESDTGAWNSPFTLFATYSYAIHSVSRSLSVDTVEVGSILVRGTAVLLCFRRSHMISPVFS